MGSALLPTPRRYVAKTAIRTPADGSDTSQNPPLVDDEALRDAVWARVQLARNLQRPHTLELMASMADDVVELHGDRAFGDD